MFYQIISTFIQDVGFQKWLRLDITLDAQVDFTTIFQVSYWTGDTSTVFIGAFQSLLWTTVLRIKLGELSEHSQGSNHLPQIVDSQPTAY